MALRYSFDLGAEADMLEGAVNDVLDAGVRTADLAPQGQDAGLDRRDGRRDRRGARGAGRLSPAGDAGGFTLPDAVGHARRAGRLRGLFPGLAPGGRPGGAAYQLVNLGGAGAAACVALVPAEPRRHPDRGDLGRHRADGPAAVALPKRELIARRNDLRMKFPAGSAPRRRSARPASTQMHRPWPDSLPRWTPQCNNRSSSDGNCIDFRPSKPLLWQT